MILTDDGHSQNLMTSLESVGISLVPPTAADSRVTQALEAAIDPSTHPVLLTATVEGFNVSVNDST